MTFRRRYFDGQVTTPVIVPGAVTEEKIADDAITSRKIKDGTITGADIGAGQVQTDDIANGAVTAQKLGSDVVVTPLPDNAVTTPKIADGAVVSVKIAAGAVGSNQLAEGSVESIKIKDGAVIASKIAANAITKSKMADNSVGYSEIASQSLEPKAIKTLSGLPPAAGQVPVYDETGPNYWWFRWADAATRPLTSPLTSAELGVGSVESEKIANNAVTTEKIQNGCVTQEKLAPGVGGGDRFVFGTLLTGFQSADALYLTGQNVPVPFTTFDMSNWVPAGAKAVIVQLGVFTESSTPPTCRAEIRVRTNVDQRDALGVPAPLLATNSNYNGGIVPLVTSGARTIEYSLDVTGAISVTMWLTIVGYII